MLVVREAEETGKRKRYRLRQERIYGTFSLAPQLTEKRCFVAAGPKSA